MAMIWGMGVMEGEDRVYNSSEFENWPGDI
jgi:hypothetical protein